MKSITLVVMVSVIVDKAEDVAPTSTETLLRDTFRSSAAEINAVMKESFELEFMADKISDANASTSEVAVKLAVPVLLKSSNVSSRLKLTETDVETRRRRDVALVALTSVIWSVLVT